MKDIQGPQETLPSICVNCPMKHLIINADDFGRDAEVNQAIMESISQGLCSSTTIMVNMPGFEEACQICHDHKLTDQIGLHLVLSEGRPLTDEMKECSRFCSSEGHFLQTGRGHFFRLSAEDKNAVANEISAQIDRCREYGLPLTHADSHQHMHVEWGIAGVLLQVAEKKGIRFVRLSRHLDPNSTFIRNLYRRLFNLRIRSKGAAATQCFGTVEDFISLRSSGNYNTSSFEIMIHPVFDDEGLLIDDSSREPLGQYVTKVCGYRNAVPFSCV